MAINPTEVSIINIPDLKSLAGITDSDLIIIGRGVEAYKITISQLKNDFGIPTFSEAIADLSDLAVAVGSLENKPVLLFETQELTEAQQQVVRDNASLFSKDEVTQSVQEVDNTLLIDEETASLILKRAFNDEIVSAIPLSSLVTQPKQKVLFTHVITEEDLAGEENISLQLDSSPDLLEWFDLHINGGFVSDNSYEITEDTLSIIKSEISEVSIGDKVIFRYREL